MWLVGGAAVVLGTTPPARGGRAGFACSGGGAFEEDDRGVARGGEGAGKEGGPAMGPSGLTDTVGGTREEAAVMSV